MKAQIIMASVVLTGMLAGCGSSDSRNGADGVNEPAGVTFSVGIGGFDSNDNDDSAQSDVAGPVQRSSRQSIGTGVVFSVSSSNFGRGGGEMLQGARAVPQGSVPGQVVVTSSNPAAARAYLQQSGLTILRAVRLETLGEEMITVSTGNSRLENVLEALNASGRFALVQPNYRYISLGTLAPANPLLVNAGFDSTSTPRTGGTIAIIDGVVDTTHSALAGAGVGQKIVVADSRVSSHGTAVASLLVGSGKVQGVAQGARLLSFAAMSPAGKTGSLQSASEWVAEAMDEAIRARPDVLSMSLGGPRDPVVERLVNAAAGKGITIIAAAGNGGPRAKPVWPAAYPTVIAVTATDKENKIYRNANQGDYVEIAAPGVGLIAATREGYGMVTGTSFSTAVLAGAALRLKRAHPGGMRSYMRQSARDLGAPGRDPVFGYGMVQLP